MIILEYSSKPFYNLSEAVVAADAARRTCNSSHGQAGRARPQLLPSDARQTHRRQQRLQHVQWRHRVKVPAKPGADQQLAY